MLLPKPMPQKVSGATKAKALKLFTKAEADAKYASAKTATFEKLKAEMENE